MSDEKKETINEINVEEIRQRAVELARNTRHEWRQRGNKIFCTSCQFEHGFFVPPNKVMVGIKDGLPIIKDLDEVGKNSSPPSS